MSSPTIAIAVFLAGSSANDTSGIALLVSQETTVEAQQREIPVPPFAVAPAPVLAPEPSAIEAIPAAESNEPLPFDEDMAASRSETLQTESEDPAGSAAFPDVVLADDSAIVVTGRTRIPGDPLESVNVKSFKTVQSVDKAVIAPVAQGYKKGLPKPVRKGLRNILNNLNEPVVFLNFLLQLKPGKAIETLGRFTINSTIGVGGVMDVAKKRPFNLPPRSNGFGDTLGYYGVGPGPYLFLPLIGSTTVRDLFGRVTDLAVLPTAVGKPFADPVLALTKGSVSALDERVANDDMLKQINDSDDPYLTMREYYLTKRKAEIDALRGHGPAFDDTLPESAKNEHTTAPDQIAISPIALAPPIVEPQPLAVESVASGSPLLHVRDDR